MANEVCAPAEIERFRSCTVVVPCFNEAQRLPVEDFLSFVSGTDEVGLLFVNDGSTDGTERILATMVANFPKAMRLLSLERNQGKAEAVRIGLLSSISSSAYVGFWDADLATPLDEIPAFIKILQDDPRLQMVFGARVRLLGRSIHRRAARHYLGRCFATVASTMLRIPIYDTQCGAKIFRVTSALEEVLGEPFKSGWIFDVEILARWIKRLGGNALEMQNLIYELPLRSWKDVAGSKVKVTGFIAAIFDLARIYKNNLRR